MHPCPSSKRSLLCSNFIPLLQATVPFPSTHGGHRVAAAQAWKGALEEGERTPLCPGSRWRLLGNKEGMKSQGKRGKQQKRNRLKEVVIKCEAGDFQGVFQLWRKSAAVLRHWFLVRFFFSKESLQLELWTRSQHQFNSNAGRTAVFKSFLQSERLPGASRHAPWGSVRLPALVGWAGQPSH